jgi:hypothetical protein
MWGGRGLVLTWICCIVVSFHRFVCAQARPSSRSVITGCSRLTFFDRAGAQVSLGDEQVTVELGAEPAPARAGGEHDSWGIGQRLQPTGDEEPGGVGGCHVDDYHVGVEGDGGPDRRITGPDVGDVDSLRAQQSSERRAGDLVIIDDQDPRWLLSADSAGSV